MARHVTDFVIGKIRQWEGEKLRAYQDSAGVWTIGVGHTAGVKKGQTINKATSASYLKADLATAEQAVDSLVKVPLTDNQFGALVSFTFNTGVGAFRGSTLLKKLNAGDFAAVPLELAKWNRATVNGKRVVLPGLTNRRAAEIGLWATGSHVSSADVTPAKPAPPPLVSSKTTLTGIGAATTTGLGLLGQVSDASDQASTAYSQASGVWGTVAPVLQFLGSPKVLIALLLLSLIAMGVVIYRHRRYVRDNPA